MRIENQTNRNNSKAFQKKNKLKKGTKTQEGNYDNNDHLDLSSGIVLLNHLLNKPEYQYRPVPFYFTNSAMRNTQQASDISKAIQQSASSYDVSLNYDMILDLVLNHENEIAHNKRQSSNTFSSKMISPGINVDQTRAYQHISLRENETEFFEDFHNKGINNDLPQNLMTIVVMEYFQLKQARKISISNQKEQIQLLTKIFNLSSNQNISQNKNQLNKILNLYSAVD